ncbi:MAG TPA: CDP-6-deoxy-delta-3,4-glucoseen reductase [Gammaproteobacteria bacterium]|nr:CDP-6-deoxy-delta-3,4-glucoseen reductase [Gammaproteobacteria bacterium]
MTDTFTISNSGETFVAEQDEHLLDAALRAGIVIPHNCRNGFCGSCRARVISGEVDPGEIKPEVISEEDQGKGYILCCQAKPLSDIELDVETIDAIADIEIKTLPTRIKRLEKLSHDVMLMELSLPPNESLRFRAGQYIDILLRDGRRRSFSMASMPGQGNLLEFHIRKVPGGHFTTQVFEELKEKDMLRLQGPFGTFFLRENSDRPVILIGGGTGLAPLKSIIEQVMEDSCDRSLHLFWGVRAGEDLYMDAEVKTWIDRLECLKYTPVLSEPEDSDNWQGSTGWVHEAVVEAYPDLSAFDVYASGPPPMIDAIRKLFPHQGLEEGRLYFDSFEYTSDGA